MILLLIIDHLPTSENMASWKRTLDAFRALLQDVQLTTLLLPPITSYIVQHSFTAWRDNAFRHQRRIIMSRRQNQSDATSETNISEDDLNHSIEQIWRDLDGRIPQ